MSRARPLPVLRTAAERDALPSSPPTRSLPLPLQALLPVLCAAAEDDELPVRHNEDKLNVVLSQQVRWPVDTRTAGVFFRAGGRSGSSLKYILGQ